MPRASLAAAPAREAAPAAVLVTMDDAGARCGLHGRTIRRAVSAGELPGYKFGKAFRVRVDELDAWIASKAIPNARSVRR